MTSSVGLKGGDVSEEEQIDCIRFVKIGYDSSDPSDSRSDTTMKKTPRIWHAFHIRKSEEYTLDLDRSYSRCFFRSRVTPRVTRITRVVANLCESNTIIITGYPIDGAICSSDEGRVRK